MPANIKAKTRTSPKTKTRTTKSKQGKQASKGTEVKPEILAAISYIIGIFALIIYAAEKGKNKYVTFHALQAAVTFVLASCVILAGILLSVVIAIIPIMGLIISPLMFIAVLVIGAIYLAGSIYLAYKAYKGKGLEIPMIAELIRPYT